MKIKVGNVSEVEEDSPTIKIKVGGDAPVHEEDTGQPDIKIRIKQYPVLGLDEEGDGPDIKIKINQTVEEEQEETNTIKVKVSKPLTEEEPEVRDKIKIKVGDTPEDDIPTPEQKQPVQKTMRLAARRSLNGDIMIFDHKDIDIVLKLSKGRIVAVPKEQQDDKVYESQLRLFEYLARKGIVDYEAIQGGNMFMAMEAKLQESDDYDVPQIALVTIAKWIEQERPYFEWQEKWEEEQERKLLEPEEGEYTEFDPDKYHSEEKGSMRPKAVPFGTPGIYRF